MSQSVPVPEGYVLVSRTWYESALFLMDGRDGCPFCGSLEPPVVEAEKTFGPRSRSLARKGCRTCNKWWSPVQIVDS